MKLTEICLKTRRPSTSVVVALRDESSALLLDSCTGRAEAVESVVVALRDESSALLLDSCTGRAEAVETRRKRKTHVVIEDIIFVDIAIHCCTVVVIILLLYTELSCQL